MGDGLADACRVPKVVELNNAGKAVRAYSIYRLSRVNPQFGDRTQSYYNRPDRY